MFKNITEADINEIVTQLVEWKTSGRDKKTINSIEANIRELANATGLPFEFLKGKINIRANRVIDGVGNDPIYA